MSNFWPCGLIVPFGQIYLYKVERVTRISLQSSDTLVSRADIAACANLGQFTYRNVNRPNLTLMSWARRKFKKKVKGKTRASYFLRGIAERQPELFAHWKCGMKGVFV